MKLSSHTYTRGKRRTGVQIDFPYRLTCILKFSEGHKYFCFCLFVFSNPWSRDNANYQDTERLYMLLRNLILQCWRGLAILALLPHLLDTQHGCVTQLQGERDIGPDNFWAINSHSLHFPLFYSRKHIWTKDMQVKLLKY